MKNLFLGFLLGLSAFAGISYAQVVVEPIVDPKIEPFVLIDPIRDSKPIPYEILEKVGSVSIIPFGASLFYDKKDSIDHQYSIRFDSKDYLVSSYNWDYFHPQCIIVNDLATSFCGSFSITIL